MKSAEDAAKKAALSATNLDELRKSVEALEAANIPAAKSFDQMAEKIREQSKQTQIAIEADAARMVTTKKLTVAQAEEWKGLKVREDAAKTTQKLAEVEAKRAEQDKKYADLRLDFEKRYADMVGLSSEAVSKSISKQAEEYRKAIEAGENAAEELVRLEEWKRDQIQRASREAMDGAQVALRDYQVEASNQAKSMNDAFRGLFSGMDSGWKSAWEQMIETGKVSLSSFRSAFASFLADLMHMAITRPITVQIAGVVSGMLGTGGVAYAAGGSGSSSGGTGGLLGNIPFSSILPDSWTSGTAGLFSGITGGINSFASNLTGGFFASSATEAQFNALANSITGGWGVGGSTLLGTLGAAGAGFGLGSLAGSLLFPNQPNISTGAGIGGGLGAAIGSVVPGIGTLLGGTIGSLLGGGIGSLFGGGRRTHASVYGKMEDVGFSRDQQTYIDAFMGGAWYDRAGKSEAEPFAQGIAQVASQTAGSLLDIAGALPEQIRQNALSGLETATWSAGRGISDASWNFQWWKEGMAEEDLEEAAQDMRNQMTAVAQQVFSNAGISQFFDTFDVTTDEGVQKASTALSAISAVKSATDAIKSPLSEMEQQAQSAKGQLDAWTQGMKDSGVNAQYAAGLISEYRNAFITDYIKTLDESLHPLSAYAQAVKAANEAVDQRKKALEIIGATEGQLAEVEAMRAEVVKQATEEMLRSFDQSVAQRWAAVNGNSDEVGRAISQANELRETIQQFGEGSAQVAELLKLHAAETVKAAQDAAKSEYDSLKAQMDALEQQRVQLQQQAIQEQINAINEQLSAAKTLKSTWEGLDKSLGQSRYNLFAGSANLDAENRLGVTQAEFRRLSGLALGGDSDAAGQLAGVGTSLLDLVKQTAGTEEEYLDAFWAVNAQLKSAQDAAGAQVSAADKQLEALQGQLDVQNAELAELQGQSATLEEIEKQIAELRPLLDAAGDKAGVKAFARGGLAMPGWAVVGEEGPELVNFSQPGRVYTAADTAALFRSATPRAAGTDSGSDAEVKALRREVYQLRRDMLISMSEIARFSRRTSDMVEAWDREGMPGVRA
ncbi:phage tail tape measure C-terminal domain-containing protein [Bilophila wadsworthia]|uniref:phage tail tape measure C-terminal domain-containing protein n=1 Tax=Bilophila wadsworthia TaxID=35833 RepID=UPI003A86E513